MTQTETATEWIKRSWRLAAWVAATFLVLVGGAMVISDIRVRQDDPLKSPALKDYKDKLRLDPGDETIKAKIRQSDLELRTRYFRHLAKKESGVYLLLGAAACFVVAINCSRARQTPLPDCKPAPLLGSNHASRWCVVGSGVAVTGILLLSSFGLTTTVPRQATEIHKLLNGDTAASETRDTLLSEQSRRNWVRFLGPAGCGAAFFTKVPSGWDATNGSGIAWKIPTPASGYNSPIVWENRVFLSGANEVECAIYCYDAETGRSLWRQSVDSATAAFKSASQGVAVANWAASSMATDGERVYAFFGSGDLVALSLEGEPVWSKALGPLNNAYGHAASLITWRGKVILQLDQGEAEARKSKLCLFDGRNGQLLWQRPRQVGSSWATPLIVEAAGKAQIITAAVPWVIAYAAGDGTELWRVEGLNGEITPSPAFAGGLVFAVSPSEKLFAIRPDGSGNVSSTKVAWTAEENVPDITSPVSDGELLFTLTTSGTLTCFNAADGNKAWEHDFAMEFHSSPAIAAGRVYLFSRKGTAIIVQAARQFKELFRTDMSDTFDASPAFAEGRMFLRGETNIWCIGPVEQKLAKQ